MKPKAPATLKSRPFSVKDLDVVPEYDENDEEGNKVSLLLFGQFNMFSGTGAYYGFVDRMADEGLISGYMHVSDDSDGDSEHGSILVSQLVAADLLTIDIEGMGLTFQDIASWDNKSDAEVEAELGAKQH